MKQRLFSGWLISLVAAAMLAAGAGGAADHADAAASKHQIKAKIKRGTLTVDGTRASEEIVLRLRAGDPATLEVVTPAAVLGFPRDAFARIEVEAGDGDDLLRIDEANGIFTDTEATILDGEDDDDDLRGGARVETFVGGSGDDAADGNQGNDVAFLGSGDDSFTWDPGDGSDRVEGQRGDDTLVFNGSGGAENFDASANGERLRFFRSLGNIVMDVDGTERVDLRALGGADNTVMNDLARTDVEAFDIDLAAALGGSAGDGQPDSVTLLGGAATGGESDDDEGDDDDDGDDDGDDDERRADEEVRIAGADGTASVVGLSASVRIAHADAAIDTLRVNTLEGDDAVDAAGLVSSAIKLVLDGGPDDDQLVGGTGAEVLFGGPGDDEADGNQGNDSAFLGDGDDSFTWDPGDGSDLVEGGDGSDRMIFNGSGGNEIFELLPNGQRLKFTRNLGNIVMDVDDVERVDLDALGGTDSATVNDLSATDVTDVRIDLEGVLGGGAPDGAADVVTVNATDGVDVLDIAAVGGQTRVTGLAATVRIERSEPALDRLVVNTLAGVDQVTVGAGVAALIAATVND